MQIHHVQLMIPRDGQDEARHFYGELLGLEPAERPANMPNPEGIWFELGDQQIHLGVQDAAPDRTRAHVAFLVESLDPLVARLRDAGVELRPSNDVAGLRRVHVWDPFGNRLELMGR